MAASSAERSIQEDEVQKLLRKRIEHETIEGRRPGSELMMKKSGFVKKLERAGFQEHNSDDLCGLNSLMYIGLPFTNLGKNKLRKRKQLREGTQSMLPRVGGLYDLNLYAVELQQRSLAGDVHPPLARRVMDRTKGFCAAEDLKPEDNAQDRRESSIGRQLTQQLPSLTAMSAKSRDSRGRSRSPSIQQERQISNKSVSALADSLKSQGSAIKRKGFSRSWVDLVVALSFYPTDWLARLAANDFLSDPGLMPGMYIEWAAAVKNLADSGQLSTAGDASQSRRWHAWNSRHQASLTGPAPLPSRHLTTVTPQASHRWPLTCSEPRGE